MTNKIPIANGLVKGNLNQLTQEYLINYMPKEEEYDPKLELAILMVKDGQSKGAYRSLRFTNSAQIKSFILGMVKGYFLFGKQNKEINAGNYLYKKDKFWKDICKALNGN